MAGERKGKGRNEGEPGESIKRFIERDERERVDGKGGIQNRWSERMRLSREMETESMTGRLIGHFVPSLAESPHRRTHTH